MDLRVKTYSLRWDNNKRLPRFHLLSAREKDNTSIELRWSTWLRTFSFHIQYHQQGALIANSQDSREDEEYLGYSLLAAPYTDVSLDLQVSAYRQ